MKVTQLIELTEAVVNSKTSFSLSNLQKNILQECCQNETKTYEQIALAFNYSPNYLKKKVVPVLWKTLSETFEEKVTKANCRSILEKNVIGWQESRIPQVPLDRPEGPVPLGSPFYVHRLALEQRGYEELLQPGALLCLQGTSKVGKTSLFARLFNGLEKQGYRTICLSLNHASTDILSSVEKFLRWLCANITQQFEKKIDLQEFWCEEIGALTNCSLYLKQHLLSLTQTPIVLALDKFERLCAHPTIANDFLCLLRSWYEEAKNSTLWQKLRLVLVYSTEGHLLLKTNKPIIDVGFTLDIPPFNAEELRKLAGYHHLYLTASEGNHLHSLLGGFPDLVRRFFYHTVKSDRDWSAFLPDLTMDTGIMSDRLHEKLHWLKTYPDLLTTYRCIVNSETSLTLDPQIAFQLQNLGLIRRNGDRVVVSCELYRQYFCKHLY